MKYTPEINAAIIRMCENVWRQCPWAAPKDWVDPQDPLASFSKDIKDMKL